jgi:hypothetical protein
MAFQVVRDTKTDDLLPAGHPAHRSLSGPSAAHVPHQYTAVALFDGLGAVQAVFADRCGY